MKLIKYEMSGHHLINTSEYTLRMTTNRTGMTILF